MSNSVVGYHRLKDESQRHTYKKVCQIALDPLSVNYQMPWVSRLLIRYLLVVVTASLVKSASVLRTGMRPLRRCIATQKGVMERRTFKYRESTVERLTPANLKLEDRPNGYRTFLMIQFPFVLVSSNTA